MLKATLFDTRTSVAGLTQMRAIKVSWDRTYERLLKLRSESQAEIQAIDQEIKPRLFQDYLGWEVIHHAILGYPAQGAFHPVIAFTPDSEETLVARCRAHKTALRACLDQYPAEDRAVLRPRMHAWKPGWLVPCEEDGTLGAPISTGELPIL
jgi:hypothetical protein